MNLRMLTLVTLTAVALLSACGGGGGGDAEEVADKYVGVYDLSCSGVGTGSGNGEVLLTKASANSLTGTSTVRVYTTPNCTGAATSQSFPAALVVDGAVTVNGQSGDRVTDTSFGSTDKDFFLLAGNRLYSAAAASPKDADGYPTQLDLTTYSTKR